MSHDHVPSLSEAWGNVPGRLHSQKLSTLVRSLRLTVRFWHLGFRIGGYQLWLRKKPKRPKLREDSASRQSSESAGFRSVAGFEKR